MIRVFKPCVGEEEAKAVAEVLKSGWIGLGPKTAEFEKKFAAFVGTKFTVATNSCTAALDLALRLIGIRKGDEVIVPTITFVSTAHAVIYNNATPIFADVDEETLCIDPYDIERRITPRTKAIIVVHYGGRPVEMDKIKEVAGHISIIEDAAHACGGEYKGKKCGNLADIGCFSFHAVKNLAVGDGGALTLNDEEMYKRAKRLTWLGIDKSTWERTDMDRRYWWQYSVEETGLKCHMNDITAAIALVQLEKLEQMNKRRKEIVKMYNEGLGDIPWLRLPPQDDDNFKSSWHIYHIKCDKRDELSVYLQEHGIATGVHYTPIHTYKCYGNTPVLPVAERISKKILTLPMYPDLTDDEVYKIIEVIRSFRG